MRQHKQEKTLSDILPDENEWSAKTIRRVVKIGCVVNALLMALKLSAGYFGHSDALVADGFHSLNDLAADIIMLVFVGLSYRHADGKYAYGYGKFETFSSFLISAFLVVVGCHIAWEGVESIVGYLHGEELPQPDIWTVVVVLVAMTCKEGLFRFYTYTGRKQHSQALVANAWHHRSDAFASIATLIGVTFAHFFGVGFRILDPIASLVLSVFIIVPAIRLFRPAFAQLMERALSDEEVAKAVGIVENVPGVMEITHLRTRRIGHNLAFDIGVKVPSDSSLKQAEAISDAVKAAMCKAFCPHVIITVETKAA